MKVKIDEKLICIPPHISTTWDQVTSLQSKENPETKKFTLAIHLLDGKVVQIPEIESSIVDVAFSAHMKHLGKKPTTEDPKTVGGMLQQMTGLSADQLSGMPIRFGISSGMPGMENLETAFQHNQAQADLPDMPQEVLEKISEMAKMMLGGDLGSFPKPEPHCNCTHCQLARVIHDISKKEVVEEEPVSDEELTFRTWDIKDNGKNMFCVTNPLDPKEQYTVYLGTPIGCTCGHHDCEHIKAVLYS
ncbi:MAG: hypothetical protein S4CHLAM2_07250 [Chlamydiales bacterium]|nr:hypothetical protein [Chlamydiales bacterium]